MSSLRRSRFSRNNSTRTSAVQIGLSIALISISAVLLTAASSKPDPLATRAKAAIAPDFAGAKDLAIAGPASGSPRSATSAPFTFENTGSLNTARQDHTATLLPNGKVLVAGGFGNGAWLGSVELYDPASGSWTPTGSLHTPRLRYTATLLRNGKVLVAGGNYDGSYLSSTELYDPASGSWTPAGSLHTAREFHTATLLPDGRVLVAGGQNLGGFLSSTELYDPASGSWTPTGGLNTARAGHTATLLSNGKVLLAGSGGNGSSAEIYDPATGSWTVTGSLHTPRESHTATLLPNGKVLVAGGFWFAYGYLNSAELYDPASGSWTFTGSLHTARDSHTATLLPDGRVLMAGGINGNFLSSAELYDPASRTWTVTGSLNAARDSHTATLLPNGRVLIAGGENGHPVISAELYDSANGSSTTTGNVNTARTYHTATLLPNGKVLVAAGAVNGGGLNSAELYDPASGSWTATGNLNAARDTHTATLLPNRKVLVAGGFTGAAGWLSSAELYDLSSGIWTVTGSLNVARNYHTATLLPNGKVLLAGGNLGGPFQPSLTSSELYDPANGNWTTTGSLNTGRYWHTATLLPNGKVLVAGGNAIASFQNRCDAKDLGGIELIVLSSAELYDPASGTWTPTGSLNFAHSNHTATLLPNGKVLVAGGNNYSDSAELYDPASETWTVTGSLHDARYDHTATLLPNGKVLVAAGRGTGGDLSSAELYDPASGSWTTTASLSNARELHTATLLPNGEVLVAGGENIGGGYLSSAELYDTGLGFLPDWQPQITAATSPLITGSRLVLAGSGFQGISQASSGNSQDSSTNYPVVQLRSINNEQIAYLPVDPTAGWSDTAFTSLPVVSFPPGPALVTVFTNGIPSDSKYLVEIPPPRVVSRKLHSGVPFDINLPLFGNPGIECRNGGVTNDHQIVLSFPNAVTFDSTAVTAGAGGTANLASPPTISPDETQVTVNLTNVSNAQRITVTLFGANYGFGAVEVAVPMGILLGDTSGNGVVNASDLTKTKGQAGQQLTGQNFREDVNASGSINASDIGIVKSMSGTALP